MKYEFNKIFFSFHKVRKKMLEKQNLKQNYWTKLEKMEKNLILGPKIFFRGFYLYLMLEIVTSYHCM